MTDVHTDRTRNSMLRSYVAEWAELCQPDAIEW